MAYTTKPFKIFVKESVNVKNNLDTVCKRDYNEQPTISGSESKNIYLEILNDAELSYKDVIDDVDTKSMNNPSPALHKNQNPHRGTKSDLFFAAENNDVNSLNYTLDLQPEWLDCCDEFGWTPLMIACCAGSLHTIKILLNRGANVLIKDKAGNTAISLAKKSSVYNEISKIMLSHRQQKQYTRNKNKSNTEFYCDMCEIKFRNRRKHLASTIHNLNISKSKKSTTYYGIPDSNKGFQIMLKTGWNREVGLGPEGFGQKYPVKTVLKQDKKGLGLFCGKPKVTHKINSVGETKIVEHRNKIEIESKRNKDRRKEILFRREFL